MLYNEILCLARLIKNGNSIESNNLIRNHNTDEKVLNRQFIRSACEKRAKDITDRSTKFIRFEITINNFNTLDYMDVKLIRDRMYPCSNMHKNIPKIISEVKEFVLLENILLSKGESIVTVNNI